MKIAEISPYFKKLDKASNDNHQLITTLYNFPKLWRSSFIHNK